MRSEWELWRRGRTLTARFSNISRYVAMVYSVWFSAWDLSIKVETKRRWSTNRKPIHGFRQLTAQWARSAGEKQWEVDGNGAWQKLEGFRMRNVAIRDWLSSLFNNLHGQNILFVVIYPEFCSWPFYWLYETLPCHCSWIFLSSTNTNNNVEDSFEWSQKEFEIKIQLQIMIL